MALEVCKLILRGKEYEVRSGMILGHALEKIGVNSESVLATRDGELIPEDEILLQDIRDIREIRFVLEKSVNNQVVINSRV